jgi:hypothetical protein
MVGRHSRTEAGAGSIPCAARTRVGKIADRLQPSANAGTRYVELRLMHVSGLFFLHLTQEGAGPGTGVASAQARPQHLSCPYRPTRAKACRACRAPVPPRKSASQVRPRAEREPFILAQLGPLGPNTSPAIIPRHRNCHFPGAQASCATAP